MENGSLLHGLRRRSTVLTSSAISSLCLAALASSCVDTSEEVTATVADFRGDARGAYTLVHDDLCAYGTDGLRDHALVELTRRKLRAGFGAIAAQCSERGYWPTLVDAIEQGHEIVNHSMSHPSLRQNRDYAEQVDAARELIERKVPGAKVTFFIFPYDEFDDEAIDHLKAQGYLGARAGVRGLNSATPSDPLRLRFDVYGPDYSIYKKAVDDGDVKDVLRHYVDQAISKRKWAIREVHGVNDDSWESVPLDDYVAHLDYVRKRVTDGDLWMDTPTEITRYTQTHRLCGTPTVDGNSLRFEGPATDCEKYRTTLTVRVFSPSGISGLTATQSGKRLTTRSIDTYNALIDDVDPALETTLDFHGAFGPGASLGGAPGDGGSSATGGGADTMTGGSSSDGAATTGGSTSSGGGAQGGASTGGTGLGGVDMGGAGAAAP